MSRTDSGDVLDTGRGLVMNGAEGWVESAAFVCPGARRLLLHPPFGWTIILLPSSLHFFSFSAAGGHNVLSIELFIIQQTVLLSLYGNEGKGEMRDNKPKKKEKKTFTTRENDSSWLLIGVGSVPSVKRKK